MEAAIPDWFTPTNLANISSSVRKLPHWESIGGTYSVTFRLADSIPRELQVLWNELKRKFHERHPGPWSLDVEILYRDTITNKMEDLLDSGYGTCLLKDRSARTIVKDALLFFNEDRYHMDTFGILPNHVHALFAPIPPVKLASILHSWKSFTAHKLCKLGYCQAPVWLDENWDTLVRSERQFLRFRDYVLKNPKKANLAEGSYCLWNAAGRACNGE